MWLDEEVRGKGVEGKIREKVAGRADLQLGKKGLSNSFIREVRGRLERQGIVKVRVLKSYRRASSLDRRKIAELVAERVGAELFEVRGYTFILVRPRDKDKSIAKQ